MIARILRMLFPPKCVLCKRLLADNETDLCHPCRVNAPEYTSAKNNLTFIARWTTVWYYKGNVRSSILRYKFSNARSYSGVFGRLLAMQILKDLPEDIDILTWIPVSKFRRFTRGYDQVELLAKEISEQINIPATRQLVKIRNTPAQSTLDHAAHRRANVLGAYAVINPEQVAGKRILLIDDVLTTGATVSECAKMLLFAGAKEIYFASIAASPRKKK